MRKQIISVPMLVALLLFGTSAADAKKKPEAPVLESFVANVEGEPGSPHLTVAIQEFTTDDEVQELAQRYARGGEGSLRSALDKSKKGYFNLGSSETMRLRIIQDRPNGAGRRLLLVGETPRAYSPQAAAQASGPAPRLVLAGGGGYTAIQLDVDGQGNGKGLMLPFCKVGFTAQGQLAITPMAATSPLNVVQAAHPPYQLVNVHREK
jgi:hypothetical protein